MYIRTHKPPRRMIIILETINIFCAIITVLATAGAIQYIVISAGDYKIWG